MECKVKFDNNTIQGVFSSGQTLSGVIKLYNDKLRRIKKLKISVEGWAACEWTEGEGRRSVNYCGRENYISQQVGKYDYSNVDLQPGKHEYDFSCALPPRIPASFESKNGYIRYQIKIFISRPMTYDLQFAIPFTVIRDPVKRTLTYPVKAGTKFIAAEIPTNYYVAGQRIPVSIKINNESRSDVEQIKVSLRMVMFYNSQTPLKKILERNVSILESSLPGCRGNSRESYETELEIPKSVKPTNIEFCRVTQVSYEIWVYRKDDGGDKLRLPITIDGLGLQNYLQVSSRGTRPSTSRSHHSAANNDRVSESSARASAASFKGSQDLRKDFDKESCSFTADFYSLAPPTYLEAINQAYPD